MKKMRFLGTKILLKASANERKGGGRRYELTEPGRSEGGWDPPTLHAFLSLSVVSLYVDCTIKPFRSSLSYYANASQCFRFSLYGSTALLGLGLLFEVPRSHSRHNTLGKIPLDEWSARRRDHYLTTDNTHKKQTSMFPAGFEPVIPASEQPQTHALDCAATGIGAFPIYSQDF